MKLNAILIGLGLAAASLALASGCEKEDAATGTNGADDHGHAHDDGHDHDEEHSAGHGGPVVQLGEATIGAFQVSASRDEGQIEAGGEAPVDVTLTPASGSAGEGAKVAAVRFWIGTEDAKGSVKARAEVEDADEPNRWHTHVEAPAPLPDGSKLWVEIEDEAGGTSTGSFDLKQ